ncbi:MAG: molybdopterin-containing oxidoreductase family protein [Gammaproteobacteria bacterium]
MTIYKGACPHDCPDTCAWLVEVEDGIAKAVTGDPSHPFTEGVLCSKLKHYERRVYSDKRVLYPQRRIGSKGSGRFERISWETAVEEIAARLKTDVDEHGPLSVMPHNFAGTIGLLQRYAGEPFFARLGATGVHRDICGAVAAEGVIDSVGTTDGMAPEDLIHSRLILIWGTNTVTTNLHLWSAVIRKARANGSKVIVIDPVRTPTAASADQHIQIKPGTDGALALGLMQIIVNESLFDKDYVTRHTHGFEELCERVVEFTPSRVAAITGLAESEIVGLARSYATITPAAIRLSVGMERHANGYSMLRAVSCLPGLTGAWRHLGGGICQFMAGTVGSALNLSAIHPPPDWPTPSRMVHLAQLGRALTDDTMSPPIKSLIVYNSNPLITAPGQSLTRAGLARDDLLTVVHEQFVTDTALYADYLLPATTQLEHLELMPSWGTPYLVLNQAAIEPLGEAIANTELFRRLSRAMGFDDEILLSRDEDRVRGLLNSNSELLNGISYESLSNSGWARLRLPEPFQPLANGNFPTPSGKFEFFSENAKTMGRDPLPVFEANELDKEYPLNLIAAKTPHFLNSEYVNLRDERNATQAPSIKINPDDARSRDINNGDLVRVFNRAGDLKLAADVCRDTKPGVVSMPFGWWMGSLGGQSPNALTPDGLSSIGVGSNAFDAMVDIEAQ